MSENQLPAEVAPEKLPSLARVAFAARCARRVQTLLRQSSPSISEEFLETIDRAITLAEHSSANGRPSTGLADAVAEAERRAHGPGCICPVRASENAPVTIPLAVPVVRAVAYAAAAAACAALEPSSRAAFTAIVYANEAVRAANVLPLRTPMTG